MSGRAIPSSFVKSVLQNGVGRHICQLQRLTFKFCKSNGVSIGMRDFLENHLLQFTRENPGIVIYLKPRRHRVPCLTAEYLNGNMVDFPVPSLDQYAICQWVEHLRTQSGQEIVRLRKGWHTDNPSIQGTWTPFTNKDTSINLHVLPDRKLSECVTVEKSGTEKLLEIMAKAKEISPNIHVLEEGEGIKSDLLK